MTIMGGGGGGGEPIVFECTETNMKTKRNNLLRSPPVTVVGGEL